MSATAMCGVALTAEPLDVRVAGCAALAASAGADGPAELDAMRTVAISTASC